MKNILKIWLPLVVVISAFSALAYASVQQAYRQGADDPQIQMAQDAAYALDNGKGISDILPTEPIDIDRSLAPFYVIFNAAGEPVAASGLLNGELPRLPDGVLDYTAQNGEHRLTWQPETGVRIASVIVPYGNGFVLAGRNLREVEVREAQVTLYAGLTWQLAVLSTFVVIAMSEFLLKERRPQAIPAASM